MRISLSCHNYNFNNTSSSKYNPMFGHHPDLTAMISKNRPVLVSSWFRRGGSHLDPGQNFIDIVKVFKKAFNNITNPLKMLIVGIANSEEPFSYLAAIKQINKDKPIEDSVDLHVIDLQSKPERDKLYNDAYYTMDYIPYYAKGSFVYNPHPKIPLFNYRVSDELFDFLHKTYNNPSKSKWETRVQDAITQYPENYFDIISINNVLYYMKANESQTTFETLYKVLVPNGYMINEEDVYVETSKYGDNFEYLDEGIYRKIK